MSRTARGIPASTASRLVLAMALSIVVLAANIAAQSTTAILFIGNSFTFAAGSPVHFYRAGSVTDSNDEGNGGVPALFKSFADQAGLAYDVSLETRGGVGLDFHLANKLEVIGRRPWDVVVMHGFSTLDAAKPRDPAKLVATTRQMAEFLRSKNPQAAVYIMATWSRADQTYPATGAWAGQPIDAMAGDIRAAYDLAAAGAKPHVKAVIPVGEAWTRAIETGVADSNPYDGIDAAKLNLWTYDHYHASTYGYYLEALVTFGSVTGRDPRSLGVSECSAFELGLSAAQTRTLQQIAFDQLTASGVPVAVGQPRSGPVARCAAVK